MKKCRILIILAAFLLTAGCNYVSKESDKTTLRAIEYQKMAGGKGDLHKFSVKAINSWQRDKTPLLTNFLNMYNPCVVEVEGEYRYLMWFFGWATKICNDGPGCDAIFHARSKDMKKWEVYSGNGDWDSSMDPNKWVPVLTAGDRWYENWHCGDPSVVFYQNRYYMAYSATSRDYGPTIGYPSQMTLCVMGAVSDDGIHWQKTTSPLLIRAEDTEKPVPDPNRTGDFQRPCLRRENNKWRLWFDYWLSGVGCCMGYAENDGDFLQPDGFKLKHDLAKPLLEHWPNPEVIKVNNQYISFSDTKGYPVPADGNQVWMGRQLCEAVSSDGMKWSVVGFIQPDDDADACHVPQALITEVEGKKWLYLFYATQIGRKKNDGIYHYEYDSIRSMRREIK